MIIYRRELDLPLRSKGYEFICPQCNQCYANEGFDGRCTMTCPSCQHSWRVDDNGRPKASTQVAHSQIYI